MLPAAPAKQDANPEFCHVISVWPGVGSPSIAGLVPESNECVWDGHSCPSPLLLPLVLRSFLTMLLWLLLPLVLLLWHRKTHPTPTAADKSVRPTRSGPLVGLTSVRAAFSLAGQGEGRLAEVSS